MIVLTLIALRFVPGARRGQPPTPMPLSLIPSELGKVSDAILLVQSGGRVVYSNEVAREWFGTPETHPDLERLARRARPSEALFALCAAEGQSRFSLDNRLVEGFSYTIPYDGHGAQVPAQLVLLRRPQVAPVAGSSEQTPDSARALDIFSELSQKMTASLELEATLHAILESVDRLIPNDFIEITRYDAQNQCLVPYRFVGLGAERRLRPATDLYNIDQGYSGYLFKQKQPLLVDDVDTFRKVRPAVDRKQYSFDSYLGVPLIVGGQVVGTLELASLVRSAFKENDLAILQILAGPASVALNNALLFHEGQERILELSGLASLARSVSDLRDPHELYERLVNGISPLLPARVLGFLIYNESRRTLDAQTPFQGIPAQMVELYSVTIPAGSPAEALWELENLLITTNAVEDPKMVSLGLNSMAVAAGIQRSLLVALNSSGRRLGYLQVADKLDGTSFDEDDSRLMQIVANHAASTIENMLLYRQSQERAKRSEALRRIASLSGSDATLDEILAFSLQELARLLRADLAAIYLLEENAGTLKVHKESLFGISPEQVSRLQWLSMAAPDFNQTVTGSRQALLSTDISLEPPVPLYWPLVQVFQVHSLMDVPLIVRGQAVGEIMLGSKAVGFFDKNDLTLLATTASQLASAVEKSALYSQTDEGLRRRVTQLMALTRISRELNATLDWRHLLRLVHDEVRQAIQADCGRTVLIDQTSSDLKIVFSVGDDVSETLTSAEERAIWEAGPLIIEDFADDTGMERLYPPHEGVRSALLAPIAFQGEGAGIISMHSHRPGAFDQASIEIVQSLAVQAAIALGNAQRYQDQISRTELLNRKVETMSTLLETSHLLQADHPLEKSLEAIANAIQTVTPFNVVLISVVDRDAGVLHRVAGAGIPLPAFQELQQRPQQWENVQSLLLPEFRQSRSYLIPADRRAYVLSSHVEVASILSEVQVAPGEVTERTWQPDDIFITPLYESGGKPVGLISVDAPRDGQRPDRPTVESMEVFSSQAALVIDSYNRRSELDSANRLLNDEVQRLRDSANQSQQILPVLLHKDLEQNLAIAHLNMQTRRMAMGLSLKEEISRQETRQDMLLVFARALLTNLDMDQVLVAEMSEGGPRLIHALGGVPANVNPQAMLGQRNPLRTVLTSGEPLFIENVANYADWQSSPLLVTLETSAFVCLPVFTGYPKSGPDSVPHVDSAVLLMSGMPIPPFSPEDRSVYLLLARQLGASLLSLALSAETNRRFLELNLLLEFSRQIGGQDVAGMLKNLLQSIAGVVPAADAGWVALWDETSTRLHPRVAAGYPKNAVMLDIAFRSGEALPGQVFESDEALIVPEVNFAKMYNLSPEYILKYRDATAARLPVSSLVVPLHTFGVRMGVIVLDNFKVVGAFGPGDQALVASLAQQVALTLSNLRLFKAAEDRAAQMQALTEVAGTLTSFLRVDELSASLLDLVKAVLPYDTSVLWLRQDGKLTVHAAQGFTDHEQRVGLSVDVSESRLLAEMVATSQPLSIGDVRLDDRFLFLIGPEYRSWLGVPLLSKGEVAGVLVLEKKEPHFYKPGDIQLIVTFAGQLSVAMDNARLFEQVEMYAADLEQRVSERTEQVASEHRRMQSLLQIITELSASLDLDMVLNRTLKVVNESVGAEQSSLLLIQVDSQNMMLRAAQGYIGEAGKGGQPSQLRRADGLAGWVIKNREAVLIANVLEDARWLQRQDMTAQHRSALAVPLLVGEETLGVLMLFHRQVGAFSTDQLEMLQATAKQIAVALNNAQLYGLIRDQAERLGEMLRTQHVETSRSQAILEAVADGVLVTDGHRKITLFNDSAEQILGLKRTDILGRPLDQLLGVFGGASARWSETIARWSTDPTSFTNDLYTERFELENRRVVSVQLSPVRLRNNFLGTVSIFRDITHEVEVDRLKSEFVATVSHELRTPMTSIKGYVDILLMGATGQLSPQQSSFLTVVKQNTERLSVLVNDLLDVSRIEAGKADLSMQALHIGRIAEEVVGVFTRRSAEENKPMHFVIAEQPDTPRAWGDDERVHQIIENLVENAYRYTHPDGQITLRIHPENGEIQMDVIDTGIGILPEDGAHIFERFYRGKNPLVFAASGNGLGLSIVKAMVELHGGRLWFESSGVDGDGSTFSFTLPMYEEK